MKSLGGRFLKSKRSAKGNYVTSTNSYNVRSRLIREENWLKREREKKTPIYKFRVFYPLGFKKAFSLGKNVDVIR